MASTQVKRTYLLGVWLAIFSILLALSQAQNTTSSSSSSAQDGLAEQLAALSYGVNAAWLLLTGALVFMMQAGFAILGIFYSFNTLLIQTL